jgi:signal transduction histidine kinase/CheY-like chemotaxis protein/HPt (histidine-containing phosphotransfer) domain-containing protein
VRTRAIAQRDANKRAVRFVGSIADVTDRKQAEIELVEANVRVMQAARAKEAFLATMSHEIRTPLNGVLGMTNLLAETDLNDEQRDHLRLIHASGDTLLRLIDDVLDFSKIESGHMTLESVPVEVVMVAEEAIELVADKARMKDLALLFDMDENVPFYILGDATRLRQILLNLLANAIKFTASGEIKLLMTARNKGDGTIVLEGRVRDTGIGIPADRADKLFQPFTQVDASTTRKYGGTGLGLAICKRLTTLMGGDIRVESREGEGSEFIFTILTAVAEGPMKPYMQRNVAAFAEKRALIVDRDASRRAIQLTRNAGWGLESVAVAPPEAAATFRRGPRFDILLTDLVLPSPEALELQAALLEDDSQRKALGVPLVASVLRSTVSRAELAARNLRPPIRHDFLIMRPAGRARVFEILMRAAHNEPNQDVATRPYVPEPDYKRAPGVADRSGSNANAPVAFALQMPVPGVSHGRSLNVLVAEDNEVNQRVIHGNLNKLGHRATIVSDGRRAVEEALHGKFDVILMDIHMPELDGLAAMHEIRAQLKGDDCPPIIAITAHALSGDREHYLDAGMDDYLSKPIRRAELVKVLERIQNRATGSQGNPLDSIAKHALKQAIAECEVRSDPRLIDTQILDLEQLEDLRYLTPPPDPSNLTVDLEADPVGGLIRLFQRKALERMTLMEGMLARGEWVPLAETSHSLRGASASMGFPRVAILCKELELAARAVEKAADGPPEINAKPVPTTSEMTRLLEQLRVHYFEAERAMESWMASNIGMANADIADPNR